MISRERSIAGLPRSSTLVTSRSGESISQPHLMSDSDEYLQLSRIFTDGQVSPGEILGLHLVHSLVSTPRHMLTIYSLCWAIVLACHAATNNFTGLMVARFFLGCAEASVSPGFGLLTSLWYRTSEQPLRHGIWFCGNSLSLVLGNAVAVGIWHIKDSLAPWKVIDPLCINQIFGPS